MKSTEAQTNVEVICDCPYCDAHLDIFELGNTQAVLSGELRAHNIDLEITCPECQNTFRVDSIHY